MKLILTLAALSLFLFTSTCNNQNSKSASMEITGIIEPIGMTTWQYGTHTLSTDDEFYALRSKILNLADYEGKTVTIKGEKVEGYPVDNGPVFIDVTEIKE
ncbi:hypothetical protein BH23BAC2_BH23BAC2_14390 [soil metagenome]